MRADCPTSFSSSMGFTMYSLRAVHVKNKHNAWGQRLPGLSIQTILKNLLHTMLTLTSGHLVLDDADVCEVSLFEWRLIRIKDLLRHACLEKFLSTICGASEISLFGKPYNQDPTKGPRFWELLCGSLRC